METESNLSAKELFENPQRVAPEKLKVELSDYANSFFGVYYLLAKKHKYADGFVPTLAELQETLKTHPIDSVESWFGKKDEIQRKFWNAVQQSAPEDVTKLNELARRANECTSVEEFADVWKEMIEILYNGKHHMVKPW